MIARSFAFIYGRNQPNLGLLGIAITDDSFYEAAGDGMEVLVDLVTKKVNVSGLEREWSFELSKMEKELIEAGGITQAFQKFGKKLFEVMCTATEGQIRTEKAGEVESACGSTEELQW